MKQFPFSLKIGAKDEFSKTFATMGNKIDRFGKKAKRMGQNISIGLSAPIAAFGALAVKKAADFETLNVALETATGSAEKGKAAFKDLADFAATTPFQLEEVVSGFIKLKNRGMDPSRKALIAYGNTAGAMGKSLDQMIEAVADASTMEFERLKEFGIKANQQGNNVTFTFRGVKTTVRKDSAEIEQYLQNIGNVDFAGGMDKQAKTIAGAFSNLFDSVNFSLARIGSDIAKHLELNTKVRALGEWITKLTDKFDAMPDGMKTFVSWAAVALVILGPLVMAIGQFAFGMVAIIALLPKLAGGFALVTAAAPWLLLGGLMVGVGYKLGQLIDNVGGFGTALKIVGLTIVDGILWPFRHVLQTVEGIWSLFGSPPAFLKQAANGTLASSAAAKANPDSRAAVEMRAQKIMQQNRETYELQNRAFKGDKAAIEILFKNAPAGMRTTTKTETNANVTVDQGRSMEGAM